METILFALRRDAKLLSEQLRRFPHTEEVRSSLNFIHKAPEGTPCKDPNVLCDPLLMLAIVLNANTTRLKNDGRSWSYKDTEELGSWINTGMIAYIYVYKYV
jgi:hypothetical protein